MHAAPATAPAHLAEVSVNKTLQLISILSGSISLSVCVVFFFFLLQSGERWPPIKTQNYFCLLSSRHVRKHVPGPGAASSLLKQLFAVKCNDASFEARSSCQRVRSSNVALKKRRTLRSKLLPLSDTRMSMSLPLCVKRKKKKGEEEEEEG